MKKRRIFLTILLPLLFLGLFLQVLTGTLQAKPQMVEVGGTLTADEVWTAVNSPYVLTTTVHNSRRNYT